MLAPTGWRGRMYIASSSETHVADIAPLLVAMCRTSWPFRAIWR
jgi:hypothetical protein